MFAFAQNPCDFGLCTSAACVSPAGSNGVRTEEILWVLDAVQSECYLCVLVGLSCLGLMLLNILNVLGNNPTKHPIVG